MTVRLQKVYLRAADPVRKRAQTVPRGPRQPHSVPRRLGSSSVAALIEAYEAGATTAQLAEWYGVSRTAVKALLHASEVAVRRPPGLQDEDVAEATRLYGSGWLLREIAAEFSVSPENVRRRLLEQEGAVMRSGHGAPRRPGGTVGADRSRPR